MKKVHLKTPVYATDQQRYALSSDLRVVGKHNALPGHNRDLSLEVEFLLAPSEQASACFPNVEAGLEPLYELAVAGLCDIFFSHLPFPLIGFLIKEIRIGPEPLNSILPISCKRAGQVAGNIVLTEFMDHWSLV